MNDAFKIADNASVFGIKASVNAMLEQMAGAVGSVIHNTDCRHIVRQGLVNIADGWSGESSAAGVMSGSFSQELTERLKAGVTYTFVASFLNPTDDVTVQFTVTGPPANDALVSVPAPVVVPANTQANVVITLTTSLSYDPALHSVVLELNTANLTEVNRIAMVEAGFFFGQGNIAPIIQDTRYNLTNGEWELSNDGGQTWTNIVTATNMGENIANGIEVVPPNTEVWDVNPVTGKARVTRTSPVINLTAASDVTVAGLYELVLPLPGQSTAVSLEVRHIHGDLTVEGNFFVNGATTTIDTQHLIVQDNFITANAYDAIGVPVGQYAGLEVEVSDKSNLALVRPKIQWNYDQSRWELTNEAGDVGVVMSSGDASSVSSAFSSKKGISVTYDNVNNKVDLELQVNPNGSVTAAYNAVGNDYTFDIKTIAGLTAGTYVATTINEKGQATAGTNTLTDTFTIPDYTGTGTYLDSGLQVVNKNYVDTAAGAGASTPSDLFDVNYNFDITGGALYWEHIDVPNNVNNWAKIFHELNGSDPTDQHLVFATGGDGNNPFLFTQTNDATSTTTTIASINSTGITAPGFNVSSSITLKTNIEPITGALAIVNQLDGVRYNWKSDPFGKKQVGLIAEEVEKVLPELVTDGYALSPKAVNYAQMVAVLIEAVKELTDEVNVLKEKLNAKP